MGQAERRQQMLEEFCIRRQDTYDNLAHEFHVSKMTIRRDIAALTCSYPIETMRGRYGGGVKVKDGYYPYRKWLNEKQIDFLIRMCDRVQGDDLITLYSILFQVAS